MVRDKTEDNAVGVVLVHFFKFETIEGVVQGIQYNPGITQSICILNVQHNFI